MAKLKDLVVAIGANTTDFDKKIGKTINKIKYFGKHTKRLGKDLTRSLTLPMAGIGAMAVKTAADFEFSMAKVAAVSGFAGDEMKRLENQAKQLGGSTSKSASDVAGLQLELAKLGNSASEIEAMTESVLSLSIAFDSDLSETASVVGSTLNQFGLDASESGRVADNMATLFGSSALDLEKFGIAMRTVGPTANALGVSLEDTGSALGILSNAGLDASTAGTALTKAFTTLVQNGTPANEVLSKLTDGNLSVAEGFEIFGDRAGKIIPLLQGTSGELAALTQKQIENTGAAIEARKTLEDTAQGGFDALRSAVESAGISIGQALLPTIKKLTSFVTEVASAIGEMDSRTVTIAVAVASFVAALGPLLFILPSIVGGISALISPVGLVVAAIAGAVVLIVAYWDEIKEYFTTGGGSSFLNGVVDYVNAYLNLLYDYFKFLYNSVVMLWERFGPAIVEALTTAFNIVQRIFGKLFNAIGTLFSAFSDLFQGNWGRFAQKMANVFIDAVGALLLGLNFGLGQLLGLVDRGLQALGMDSNLQEGFADIIDGMVESLNGLKYEFDQTKSEGKDFLGMISDFAGGFSFGGGGRATIGAEPSAPQDMQAMSGGMATGNRSIQAAFDERGLMGITDPKLMQERVDKAAKIHQQAIEENEARDARYQNSVDRLAGNLQNTFSSLFTGLMNGTQTFGEFMKQILMDLLVKLASMVAAFLVISALTGGAAGSLGGFLTEGFGLGGLIPMASGGIVSGPTAILAGEYGGARTNPEVIAPLDKLQSMIQGSGGGNVTVTGRISGSDILLSSERSNIYRNRVRGF